MIGARQLAVLVVAVAAGINAPTALGPAGKVMADPSPGAYQAFSPQRIVDTRSGLGAAAGPTTPGTPMSVPLPASVVGAAAVALDVTVTNPASDGFATAYPCGQDPPLASNVNFTSGATVANLVIAKPGTDGQVCVVTNVAADLVVDLEGFFPTGSYEPLPAPQRVLDTRTSGRVPAGAITMLAGGQAGGAVVANITVVDPARAGYVAVFPCGAPPPVASNLNYIAGQTVANLAIAMPGANGGICGLASSASHLVVDLQGSIPTGTSYTAVSPVRMVDTRIPIGVPLAARVGGGAVTELSFPVASGMPAVADTAVVNVTATGADASGYLTVFPCGEPVPTASNLNIAPGETRADLVVGKLGPDGTICLTGNVDVYVVVDLQGWFATGSPQPAPSTPQRQHVDVRPGLAMGYLVYLPSGYASSKGRTWPTIVFLHGSGETGTGVGPDLDRVGTNGLPMLYEQGTEPPVAAGFIVLAPQQPDGSNSPERLHLWLTQVLARYNVDRDRLYLTGLSAGGYGTFDYLGAMGDANEFAAMVPIAGGFTRGIVCANWRHTPLWSFHGESDPTVPIARDVNTVQTVNATCAPGERLRLTTYPGVGHDSWDATYDLSGMTPGQTNPQRDPYDTDVYTWMLGHLRSSER